MNLCRGIGVRLENVDTLPDLKHQIDILSEGNVVWELYPSFSTTEKELITLFTN